MPPFSADRRLATQGEFDQEIVFLFSNKSNKKDFIPVIYTEKKYEKLYIRALDIVYKEKHITKVQSRQAVKPPAV